ncbi:MAG: patatin-like phospholipase family protein [Acidimicrobiia bacterium]|nr:patatin-like phospholipase family protein [Acidimicrobiia bacterium]
MNDRFSTENDALQSLVTSSIPAFLEEMGCAVTPELIRDVEQVLLPFRIEAGQPLFAEGDESEAAYFVITGRLEIFIGDYDPDNVLRRVGRGAIIGEIGLLEDRPRTASVRADRASSLAVLSRADFERLSREHAGFLVGLTRTVVRRLSRPGPIPSSINSVAVAIAHPDIDPRVFTSRLMKAVDTAGRVAHVSAASAAQTLGARSDLDLLQVEDLLDKMEAANDHLILEADRNARGWSEVALPRADRAVIVLSSHMTKDEERAAEDFATAARLGGRGELWIAVVRETSEPDPRGLSAVTERWRADRVVHLRRGDSSDLARLARLLTGTGTGLVLGGGGARGFAHLGIFKALCEAGVEIDAVAGSSIGGILGASIASGRPADELIEVAHKRFKGVLDYTLPLVSLVKGAQITKGINKEFGGMDIEDLALPFMCVSTNLSTSQVQVHESGPITPATRATVAIPGVIPPVPMDGDLLVDGGVLDNLPIGPLRRANLVGTVIAVDLAAPVGPRAKRDFGLSVSGWKALRSTLGRRKSRLPGVTGVLLRTMIVGSMKLRDDQLAAGMADLVFRPHLRGVSMLAFDAARTVADRGYRLAQEPIAEWLATKPERKMADAAADTA